MKAGTGTSLPDWQRAHGKPALRGDLRCSPQDFQVDEELGFEPDGEGEHDYLWLEKSGANTAWVAERLAGFAGIHVRDVGYAGMKDRHAVTRQWFSVRRPAGAPADWSRFNLDGVRILKATRNRRKLRRGAHRGNRFRIVLRMVDSPVRDLEERLSTVAQQGVPNYFGEQRFGRDASNLQLAERLFAGERLSRPRRSLALSAARALIFNSVLERRVADDTWNQLLPGECANLDGSGSVFAVSEVDTELRLRLESMDIHPTGPLWGKSSPGKNALGENGNWSLLEQSVAGQFETHARGLERHGVESARRALRLAVHDLKWETGAETLTVEFSLCSGAFATSVLRELVLYRDVAA
ncbi:MAG TPA: tRNA pseudouridine(13) synthase TruD [Woeseiaceae bacterium]